MYWEGILDSSAWLMAQTAADRTWIDALLEIRTDKLVIILIFGTGLISATGYAIAQVLRAVNGSPEEVDGLQSQIMDLQQRVQKLEASVVCYSTSEKTYS